MIEPRLDLPRSKRPLAVRLAWMLLIWAASVCALGILAYCLRAWLKA